MFLRKNLTIMVLSFILCVVYYPVNAASNNGKNIPKPVSLINSNNGVVYNKGDFALIFKYLYANQDQLYEGSNKADFQKTAKPQCKERILQRYLLNIRYGIAEDFDVRLIVPVFEKYMKRESQTATLTNTNSGLGDIKLISRYRILSQKEKDPFNLAIGLGVKMPTGQTNDEDKNGNCLPGFLQTGTGSWDPVLELGAHKIMGRHWISSDIMYQIATDGKRNDEDFRGPNIFKYNLGYAFALNSFFDVQLELNGQITNKAELDGSKVENSGGHIIYATPGIHCKLRKGIHFGIGAPIPIYRDLNGKQLSEDYSILAKMVFKF